MSLLQQYVLSKDLQGFLKVRFVFIEEKNRCLSVKYNHANASNVTH